MRLGLIVPHKTKVAIALWRIAVSIANMFFNSTPPSVLTHRGLFHIQMLNLTVHN